MPACEALDGRQLLSTVAAAPAVLPTPPAAAVAKAAADLDALNPTTFAAFQGELAQAEGHSRVTVAQAGRLAQDEAGLDQAVDAAGLDAKSTSGDINHVQDILDSAFLITTYRPAGWAHKRQELNTDLAGVPGVTPFIRRTLAQMHVVARAARVTERLHVPLSADQKVLAAELGPNPDTNLGPGATNRDPLFVYYNGQVNSFVTR